MISLKTVALSFLLLGLTWSNLHAIDAQYNLLKNPGFEQGKQFWDIDGSTKVTIIHKSYSGKKAIRYGTGGIGQSTDTLSGIDGTRRYALTGYYKNLGSVDGMWMGVECSDTNWHTLGSFETALPNSYQYAPFALVFTPPAGTSYMTYWSWSEAPGGGKTLLDDLALYPENATPGNHAPSLDAVADQHHTLGAPVALQLHATDPDHDTLIYTAHGLPEESGIYLDAATGKFSGTATPLGTHTLDLYALDDKGGIAKRSLAWSITAAPVTPCNLLQNPDFETNLIGWDIYSDQTTRTTDAYSGNYAVRIKNGGLDQFSQESNGTADTYQFHGYYKSKGSLNGAWAGLIFYDKDKKVLFSQDIALPATETYKRFTVNGTSTDQVHYIQAWIWCEGSAEVYFDDLKLSSSACFHYQIPSSLPPKGISVKEAPQFVVIGFDDNTKSEGIDWAINFFKNKKNPDGSDARVSFYMNTKGLHEWIEDEPTKLVAAMQRLKSSGHELGNHTFGHHSDIPSDNWDSFANTILHLDQSQWRSKISRATDDLVNLIGVAREDIHGFRSPYLLYSQAMLEALKAENLLYDCSIEEGYAAHFDGTNFRWPYQLDQGSPGHNESWFGNPDNPASVKITSIPGLWELPNHVLMIPKDKDCARYGIQSGLWQRMKNAIPYLDDYKITGFDYNLWHEAKLTKSDVLGILKYNLDLRLQGNRAPFMFGAHTQYYTDEWADSQAPNATAAQMREAIEAFMTYALSKPEVRIRPAVDIIRWCENPVALPQH